MNTTRKAFNEIFRELPNGQLTPNTVVDINGVVIGPGVTFGVGTVFGGFDVHKIKGRELAIEEQNGVSIIKGYYGTPII